MQRIEPPRSINGFKGSKHKKGDYQNLLETICKAVIIEHMEACVIWMTIWEVGTFNLHIPLANSEGM